MRSKPVNEIEKKYESLGGPASVLGPPVDDYREELVEDKLVIFRDYAAGSIYHIPGLGTFEVHGKIWERWNSLDRGRGVLGYPTSDVQQTQDGEGSFSNFQKGNFQKGAIYYHRGTGPFAVCGCTWPP